MFHFPRCFRTTLDMFNVFISGNQRFIVFYLAFAFRGGIRPLLKRPGHPPGASFILSTITRIRTLSWFICLSSLKTWTFESCVLFSFHLLYVYFPLQGKKFVWVVFLPSSGGDRTHGPRSMNPMLIPLSYTADESHHRDPRLLVQRTFRKDQVETVREKPPECSDFRWGGNTFYKFFVMFMQSLCFMTSQLSNMLIKAPRSPIERHYGINRCQLPYKLILHVLNYILLKKY